MPFHFHCSLSQLNYPKGKVYEVSALPRAVPGPALWHPGASHLVSPMPWSARWCLGLGMGASWRHQGLWLVLQFSGTVVSSCVE